MIYWNRADNHAREKNNKKEKKMCSFFAILTVVILIGVLAYISYIEDVIKKYKLGHNLDREEKEIIRELKRSNHL